MEKDGFEISRRRVLAGVGGIGAASAGAGMGTSAFFSDQETFENNKLVAGELDLGVAWQANYSDWSEDEGTDSAATFFSTTRRGSNVDPASSGIVLSSVDCSSIPSGGQAPRTVIEIEDVKPGDFGFVAFKLGFCTTNANPGYLWTNSRLTTTSASGPNDENDRSEPEGKDPDESDPFGIEAIDGEAAGEIRVRPFYANGSGAFEDLFDDVGGSGIDFAHSFATRFDLEPTSAPTLLDYTDALAQGRGLPLTGDPQDGAFELDATTDGNFLLVRTVDSGGDVFSLLGDDRAALGTGTGNTILFGLAWGMPIDHANEVQTDSVAFDLGFYAEQERHNTGLGTSIGGLELDKSEDTAEGPGHTAAQVSGGIGHAVKVSEASFSGISGPTTVSDPDPNTALGSGPHVAVGVHAPPDLVGGDAPAIGQAPPLDTLIGFTSLPQNGTLSAANVVIGTTPFTGLIDGSQATDGALESKLENESPVDITATLWHAFRQNRDPNTLRPIMGISPGSPVRDVDGSFVQDENVSVEFPSP